jgi:hypothetical protein
MADDLGAPTVQINNVTVAVKPNSISYKKGYGDRNVRSESAGGNSIETVMTEDAETKKSMFKATFIMKQSMDALLDEWMDNGNTNTIRMSQGSFSVPFRKMAVVGEPERITGADGEVEVEFCGQPVR